MSYYAATPAYHPIQALHFGVELELLVSSRGKTYKTWHGLAADVSAALTRAGIANHVREAGAPEDYTEWSIVQEVTIPGGKGVFGLELVSPVLSASDSYAAPSWAVTLAHIFSTLNASFHLHNSPSTSTHIHLSLSPRLRASQLCALSKSILLFEAALDSLFAASPRGSSSYWTQSNRDASTALQGRSLSQCFDLLDGCLNVVTSWDGGDDEAMRALIHTMNLYPHRSATGRAHGHTADFVHGGVFKWNLAGLLPEGSSTGTVEFRQAPGSLSAAEARGWVVLAAGFVAGAVGLDEDGTNVAALDGSVEQLWWLVGRGVQASGVAGDMGDVESLFAGEGAGERVTAIKKQKNKERMEGKKVSRGWLWKG